MRLGFNKIVVLLILILGTISMNSCIGSEDRGKQPLLLADREAPLGWVYLRIYEDSTFEFESRGLERKGTIYSGIVSAKNDTLFFKYNDSIPSAGTTAIISESRVTYINGKYKERVMIRLNKLK